MQTYYLILVDQRFLFLIEKGKVENSLRTLRWFRIKDDEMELVLICMKNINIKFENINK